MNPPQVVLCQGTGPVEQQGGSQQEPSTGATSETSEQAADMGTVLLSFGHLFGLLLETCRQVDSGLGGLTNGVSINMLDRWFAAPLSLFLAIYFPPEFWILRLVLVSMPTTVLLYPKKAPLSVGASWSSAQVAQVTTFSQHSPIFPVSPCSTCAIGVEVGL